MSNRNSEEQKKPQKRLEYIGKNVRVSRTGGVAVRKTFKKDGVGATLNTNVRVWLDSVLTYNKKLIFFYIFVFQNGFELVSKGQFPFLMELLFFVAHNFE
jgi:hypothetical protein